jgi:hypothetical protein
MKTFGDLLDFAELRGGVDIFSKQQPALSRILQNALKNW